jgi:hypothetical protein
LGFFAALAPGQCLPALMLGKLGFAAKLYTPGLGAFPTSIGTARSEKRLPRESLMGSSDRAVSSGSLAFAADAVCYGNSIVLLLFDRFTIAWERRR